MLAMYDINCYKIHSRSRLLVAVLSESFTVVIVWG